jgi:GGDEF domain-containing protein
LRAAALRAAASWNQAAQATLGMSDFQVLVNRADQALYRVKENGRNQVATAAPVPTLNHDAAAE